MVYIHLVVILKFRNVRKRSISLENIIRAGILRFTGQTGRAGQMQIGGHINGHDEFWLLR